LAGLTVLFGTRLGYDGCSRSPDQLPPAALAEGDHKILQILDPCTLLLACPPAHGGAPRQARVALLGVVLSDNAAAEQALRFTRRFVTGGTVRLRLDRRQQRADDTFLAYVYVGDRCLNAELVRQGLARPDTHPADSGEMVRLIERAAEPSRAPPAMRR
jgi:hypothetical protein